MIMSNIKRKEGKRTLWEIFLNRSTRGLIFAVGYWNDLAFGRDNAQMRVVFASWKWIRSLSVFSN